jgi:hypothetical protein
MLSAPNAAMNRVPPADARNHEKSRMRMPCSGNGLPRFEGGSFGSTRAFALITGVSRFGFASMASASSFSSGARRPTDHEFAVEIHLLVA